MSFWVYIIQSQKNERYYCGHTEDLERRLSQHNSPDYKFTRTTKIIEGPWKVVCQISCDTRGEAMQLEHRIKKRGIKRYLEKRSAESR